MPIYDVTFKQPTAGNFTDKLWLLPSEGLDALRVVSRGGTQMFVLGSALADGDRVMAWDTDIEGTQKGVWRTFMANVNPNPDVDTRWMLLAPTAWNGQAAYGNQAYVTFNNQLYRSKKAIAVPTPIPTTITSYQHQATWNNIRTAQNPNSTGTQAKLFRFFSNGSGTPVWAELVFWRDSQPLSGSLPTQTTGTFRLRRVGTTLPDASIVGTYNFNRISGTHWSEIYINSQLQMETVFGGASESANQGQWILERQVQTPSTTPGPDNGDPASTPADWELITVDALWSNTAAYAINYHIRWPTTAPSTTYTEVARWNITSGSGNAGNVGACDYYAGSGATGPYAAGFFANVQPLAGGTTIPFNIPSGTQYRLRVTGNSVIPEGASATGTLTFSQPDSANRRVIRIGDGQNMITNFGNASTANGGQVILESVSTTPGSGGSYYRSTEAIPAPGAPTFITVFDYPAGGNTAGTQNVAHYFDRPGFPGGICINAAHDSLLNTTGTYRIRRVSGSTAETTGVTGTLTKATAPHGGSGYVCFRIGSVAEMQAAFGTGSNITSGANWILERQQ